MTPEDHAAFADLLSSAAMLGQDKPVEQPTTTRIWLTERQAFRSAQSE